MLPAAVDCYQRGVWMALGTAALASLRAVAWCIGLRMGRHVLAERRERLDVDGSIAWIEDKR